MVHLTTLIAEREKRDGLYFAVEYFPPRTADGLTKLYERSARIATQGEKNAGAEWKETREPINYYLRRLASFYPSRSRCLCPPLARPALTCAPPPQARCTRM